MVAITQTKVENYLKAQQQLHDDQDFKIEDIPKVDRDRKLEIAWPFVFIFTFFHVVSVIGLYYTFNGALWPTILFNAIYGQWSQWGITVGAHRLYTHRSFKAKLPTKIFLMMAFTASFQGSFIRWCRDHRVHHKYSDLEPDPYNSSRGLFYSHFGWLCVRKGKMTVEKGNQIDMSDIRDDPVASFQEKHYFTWLMPLLAFIIPTFTPYFVWNESLMAAFTISVLRHTIYLHLSSTVNSLAHFYGYRPYDKSFQPGDHKLISLLVSGEAFHNYHHVFPYDYRTSEMPMYFFSTSTILVDFLAKIGQIYDRKTANLDTITKRSARTGDGTRNLFSY